MSAIMIMKENIINTFGKDSIEADYAQYVFSRRDSEAFIMVYKQLMECAKEGKCNVLRACHLSHFSD